MWSRREMLFAAVALLSFSRRVLAADGVALLDASLKLAASARAGELDPIAWQDQMARLFADVDAARLIRSIDVDRLLRDVPAVKKGARVVPVPSHHAAVKLFAFEPGRANPPHAHESLVSMHLVLSGRFHVRHYDRLGRSEAHLIIKPTIDRVLNAGDQTSISDHRDNVHWHHAETRGVLLDVVTTTGRGANTTLIDPRAAIANSDGTLRCPRIELKKALEMYG